MSEQTELTKKIAEDGFISLLSQLDNETFTFQIEESMRTVIREVRMHGNSKAIGSLSLKLKFQPGQIEGTILVIPELSHTLPKKDRNNTLAFTNSKHGLTIDKPVATPLFKFDSETGEIE